MHALVQGGNKLHRARAHTNVNNNPNLCIGNMKRTMQTIIGLYLTAIGM